MTSLLTVVGLAAMLAAHPELETFVIAIGNNALPVDGEDEDLRPLRYADDDAAAFFTFVSDFADAAHLLAVLDAETQTRYPVLAARARAPSLAELRAVVSDVAERITHAREAGRDAEVYFFYSGHGSRRAEGAFLALLDGPLTQEILYDEILAELPARRTHLLVDACYAEAVIRPRNADRSAEIVEISEEDALGWAEQKSLRRFPSVGAVIAGASGQQAHEWDLYEGGVFTHQLLSGLRGGADVNGDAKVEYGELRAFLAAANSGVKNPRARLKVVVRAPPLNLRTSLLDLGRLKDVGWAVGASELGHFYVESEQGRRLLDMNPEAGFGLRIAVPARTPLILRTPAGEITFSLEPGAEILLSQLMLGPGNVVARGAIESALRRGLFLQPFGPRYFSGYVDSVSGADAGLNAAMAFEPPPSAKPAWIAFAGAGALVVTSVVTGILALDARSEFNGTRIQRTAYEARRRYDRYRYASFGTGTAALVAVGVGLWLYPWGE